MGTRPTAEAFIVCQSQEVSFFSGLSKISKLHCLPSGSPNGRKTNQSHMWLA